MNFKSNTLSVTISGSGEPLHIASVSDIHLGHPNTPAQHIVNNLDTMFPDNAETARLDIIFLAGDVFDRLLNLADDRAVPIRLWIARFLRMCKRLDIKVRVLEGTPGHDWRQSKLFVTINEAAEIDCDLIWQEKLTIEYMPAEGIHVLYIPDEWRPDPDDTWQEVTELLALNGLTHVDYIVMHGAFPHQLPPMAHHGCHDPQRYLSITRKYIFIGHVHQQSQYDRILAQGSADRLCHGDEGDKGHYRVIDMRGFGDDIITHVKNDNAMIYTTIDVRGLSLEVIYNRFDSLPDYPLGSHIRLYANRGDDGVAAYPVLKKKYDQYYWTLKTDKTTLSAVEVQTALVNRFQPIAITPDNIIDLLAARVADKANSQQIRDRCMELLNRSIVNGGYRP